MPNNGKPKGAVEKLVVDALQMDGPNPFKVNIPKDIETLDNILNIDSNTDDDDSGQKEKLLGIALESYLFYDQHGFRYAIVTLQTGNHVFRVDTEDYKEVLTGIYFERYNKLPSRYALDDALRYVRFIAKHNGKFHEVFNRFAFINGEFWIDLGDATRNAVRIAHNGWDIVSNPPVYFLRYQHQQILPFPSQGGNYLDLLNLMNFKREEDRILVATWPLVALNTDIPRPILMINGPQGAAKTTAALMLRLLIDPISRHGLFLRRNETEIGQVLFHHAVPFFDNLTNIKKPIEDLMCLAVTGGGISKRKLYTDDDDILMYFKRAIILTGINVPTEAQDLLDRALLIELERIPNAERKQEKVLWEAYNANLPSYLGGFCDALVKTLTVYPSIDLPNLPRMADYTSWGAAAAEALGFGKEKFIEALLSNISRRHGESLSTDTLAQVILAMIENIGECSGTVTQLWNGVKEFLTANNLSLEILPKAPNSLSRRIKEYLPLFEDLGWKIGFSASRKEGRIVSFKRINVSQ